MTRARNGRFAALRVLAWLASGTLWATACSGPQKLGGPGAVCFRADDCQAGLACVPELKGAAKRVCSADLSGIVAMVDGGPVEVAAPTGSSAPGGGSPASAGAAMAVAGLSGSGTAGIPAGGVSAGGAAGLAAAASPNGGDTAAGAGG